MSVGILAAADLGESGGPVKILAAALAAYAL